MNTGVRLWEETAVDGLTIWADLKAKMQQIAPATIPQIIASTAMTKPELVRMCRSRKRRIVKKWLRNPRNYRTVPRTDVLVVQGLGWVCHPMVAAGLREHMMAVGARGRIVVRDPSLECAGDQGA